MWVKLWDSLRDWRYKKNPKIMALWVHILLAAEWRGKERGTLVTSLRELAGGTGLSVKEVRTAFQKLCATGECVVKVIELGAQEGAQEGAQAPAKKRTKITICKYDDYQGKQGQPKVGEDTNKDTNKGTDSFNKSEEYREGAGAPAREKTLEERKDEFRKEVMSFSEKYETQMLENFIDYWAECNDNGKKMKWEITKSKGGTFSISGRLATWDRMNVERGGKSSKKSNRRKDPTAADVLGPEYVEWLKTQKGKEFNELFK